MNYYNLEREIDDKKYEGKTPMEVFKKGCNGELYIPIWVLINSTNL